jgi:hypothetical protein
VLPSAGSKKSARPTGEFRRGAEISDLLQSHRCRRNMPSAPHPCPLPATPCAIAGAIAPVRGRGTGGEAMPFPSPAREAQPRWRGGEGLVADKQLVVYVDLEGAPHLVGRLWARSRKGKESPLRPPLQPPLGPRADLPDWRMRCGRRSSSIWSPTSSERTSARSARREIIPKTKSTVA